MLLGVTSNLCFANDDDDGDDDDDDDDDDDNDIVFYLLWMMYKDKDKDTLYFTSVV